MRPDPVARERLKAAQGELMLALWGAGSVPPTFDAAGVRQEGKSLLLKRTKMVAKARPALARALGRGRFRQHFAEYAETHRMSTSAHCADASAFARWFYDRLGDEGVTERLNWQVGLRAVLGASAGTKSQVELSPEMRADLEQLGVLLAEIRERRGADATERPRLKAALVIGSLGALGVELDRRTATMLRRQLVQPIEASRLGAERSSRFDALLVALRTNLAVERVLTRHLRPDQRERYLAHTGEDPFFDQDVRRVELTAPTCEALAESVLTHWTRWFVLEGAAVEAATTSARVYSRAVSALDSDRPEVTPVTRREALLERATRYVDLQRRAEGRLVADPRLTMDERARVQRGSGSVLFEPVAEARAR